MRPRGSYSQITKQRFKVERVPRGETPVWDINLEEGWRIIGVADEYIRDSARRVTVDYVLWLWIEVPPA